MKKQFLALCVAAGLAIGVNAQQTTDPQPVQDKDVPASIQTSFKGQYPDATMPEWMMKEGKYKVHFKVNDVKQIAAFDETGALLFKGVAVKESELPASISTNTKSVYTGRAIEEVYKLDKNGTVSYLVKLNGKPETKVLYSADGQVIKDKGDW